MKKIALLLLMAMALMTLVSCGNAAAGETLAPYGVEDRFLGMWEGVSDEMRVEGKIENKVEAESAFDPDYGYTVDEEAQPAVDEAAHEAYMLFMPNGTCIRFNREADEAEFDIDEVGWYTADPQLLKMGSGYWKYTFKDKDTLILTRVDGCYNYDDDYNAVSVYTETEIVTLKRSDKIPGELPQ